MSTASDAEVTHDVSEELEAGQGEVDDAACGSEAGDTVGGGAGSEVPEDNKDLAGVRPNEVPAGSEDLAEVTSGVEASPKVPAGGEDGARVAAGVGAGGEAGDKVSAGGELCAEVSACGGGKAAAPGRVW